MTDFKLESPEFAHAYAGLDNDFALFKFYTRPVVDKETKEVGQFEATFRQPITLVETAVDPVGYLRAAAQQCLMKAVKTTGIPIEAWVVEFSPVFEKFRIPSHLYLDSRKDMHFLMTGVIQ